LATEHRRKVVSPRRRALPRTSPAPPRGVRSG
jgi:hypothetical protein